MYIDGLKKIKKKKKKREKKKAKSLRQERAFQADLEEARQLSLLEIDPNILKNDEVITFRPCNNVDLFPQNMQIQ